MGKIMPHSAKPYATVPTLLDRVQDELSAIEDITRVLGSLRDHETRLRVIKWINERFASSNEAAEPQPIVLAPAAHRPSDSGLSFPDDLFEPAADTSDAGDLHVVFDPPALKPHALDAHGPFGPAPDTPDVPPPAIPQTPLPGQPPVIAVAPPDAFELVPPSEAPRADLDDDAADDAARVIDRRQLSLRLLAELSPPPAVAVAEAAKTGDAPRERPSPKETVAKAPNARAAQAKPHAPTARQARPAKSPAAQPAASSPAAVATKAELPPVAPPQPKPEPAPDTMEAMLRRLVDDFRQIAEEWGNT